MELENTVEWMLSGDYKDRLMAEYWQALIRHRKLKNMLKKYDEGTLPFTPTCSIELFRTQKEILGAYVHILRERARIEGIGIDDVDMCVREA